MTPVTDPALVAQLDAHNAATNGTPVTDPALISQLDAMAPETSTLGAAARGALDAVPFGTKGAAAVEAGLGTGKYEDYLKELDTLIEADRQQHPIAHYGGEALGSVAPFAIPGVGEALGAETLAGRAGVGAGLGALQAASNTRAPLTSPQGLEDIALGAGSGAILNPAIGAMGDVFSKGAASAGKGLEKAANAQAVKSGGFRASMLGHLDESEVNDLGKFMNDNDLVTGSLPERMQKAAALKEAIGNKIGETGSNAATLEDPQPYIDALKSASEPYSSSANPEAKSLASTYLTGAQDIENQLPKGSTYKDVQELKELYAELAFAPDHTVKNSAAADVYGQLKQMQKDLVNQSPADFQHAMKAYSNSADVYSGIQKQLGLARTGGGMAGGMGIGKLIRQIPGMSNPAIGVPTGAALIGAGKTFTGAMVAGQALNNPSFKAQAAMALSGAAKSLAPVVNKGVAPATNSIENLLTHPAMAPYRPVYQQAVSGLNDPEEIQKKQTITDFVLSQRDPSYSSAKQKASEGLQ